MVKKKDKPKRGKSISLEKPKTLLIARERDIASDFATKVYKEFDQLIKSIVLFGSSAKKTSTPKSDIDIVIIIDDVSVKWDQELISWYREELGNIIQINPYVKPLHVNTVKLSTWWEDLLRGDPVVMNVLRYGDSLIDIGGFFNPLRVLLKEGKIKATPESIYTLLQRAPHHMTRAKQAMLSVVDGLYWTMVDSAHAALISSGTTPASPEKVPEDLLEQFVSTKRLDKKYVDSYVEIHNAAKRVIHGELTSIEGKQIDDWFVKADKFLGEMARLVDEITEKK
ncbi:MAG: nucleotidyltransferase domain-containing protein [archaeon]|nr:nucleotidyltransferase domain-containing protein [archaeon]MCR4323617.1 nucleotidyltransferase domain-containing protein [Nanoarchaeota archaeon]